MGQYLELLEKTLNEIGDKSCLKEYETWTDKNGVTWDDEGNKVSTGGLGGRHNVDSIGSKSRSFAKPKPKRTPEQEAEYLRLLKAQTARGEEFKRKERGLPPATQPK